MTLRLFHLADVHFGAPTRGLKIQPETHELVTKRRWGAFAALMDDAREQQIDAVLIAGDLFDAPRVDATLGRDVREACEMAQPAEVIIIPGNHDYWTTDGVWTAQPWPANVQILYGPAVTTYRLDNEKATIYAHGWDRPVVPVSPFLGTTEIFHKLPRPRIILAHGSEMRTQPTTWKRYAAFYAEQFQHLNPAYIALGHLHWWSAKYDQPTAPWSYSGSFAPDGFGDTGPKFYNDITIHEDQAILARRPAGSIEFEKQTIQASQIAAAQDLTDALLRIPADRRARVVLWAEILGALPATLNSTVPTIHAVVKQEYAHLSIHEQAVADSAIGGPDGQQSSLDQFLADMAALIDSEKDRDRQKLLKRVLEHGLTATAERSNPGRGNLYQ